MKLYIITFSSEAVMGVDGVLAETEDEAKALYKKVHPDREITRIQENDRSGCIPRLIDLDKLDTLW